MQSVGSCVKVTRRTEVRFVCHFVHANSVAISYAFHIKSDSAMRT